MIADQRLQANRAGPRRCLLAAQLVGSARCRVLVGALGLQLLAQRGNLALQPLQRIGRGLIPPRACPPSTLRFSFSLRAWPISASSRSASRSSAARLSSPCAV